MRPVHTVSHLEPNDRCELALAQLRLDQCEQVVRLLLVAFDVGIASDTEELSALDDHPGEQKVQVVRHHFFEGNKHQRVADANETRHACAQRHLHASHQRRGVIRIVKRHQEVQRQIRHKRERVRRVHRLRRD